MNETIAALSTPPGVAGLAVVRLSGPACRAVAAQCLGDDSPKPRLMRYGRMRHPASGETLDRLGYVFYAGPKSPTGEDVLELFTHGNPLLVDNVLQALIAVNGVRLARAGEFTLRACENGKLDLVQAEGLLALVHAQSQAALRHAGRVLDGMLSQRLRSLRQKLVDLLVRLELDVDFVEEEADPDYASWRPRFVEVLAEIEDLLRGHARGIELAQVPRIVLAGAPNAGKSSLVNALLREERVLVSDRPGTTRDFVEVSLRLPGGLVHLIDTAGLGEAVDALDERAQVKTREQMGRADVVLAVEDGTEKNEAVSGSEEKQGGSENVGSEWGWGKKDATANSTVTPVLRVRTRRDRDDFNPGGDFAVSCVTGEGLADLIAALNTLVFENAATLRSDADQEVYISTARQREGLQRAAERLHAALHWLDTDPAIEILAFEAREAVRALHELLGEVSADDVLHRLFSGFCIGK
jgi:tRNA modification GTPase